ncbi:Hypothetical_protein [Hexamita inflata]|uniref:Hypothetical_protein n=1 Tax=Hexamita inflata TaxID=28002 RepID=A0AA86N8B8_9EUKA|nr:Hypothetical protein HINF_LOCUS2305 [Hexamita inflata]CAI9919651.1 Hypothetical protein HINF_LOCUS7296 [Hexamita inflata]
MDTQSSHLSGTTWELQDEPEIGFKYEVVEEQVLPIEKSNKTRYTKYVIQMLLGISIIALFAIAITVFCQLDYKEEVTKLLLIIFSLCAIFLVIASLVYCCINDRSQVYITKYNIITDQSQFLYLQSNVV